MKPPTFIGLCPGAHLGEFYMPLEPGKSTRCPEPDCDCDLIVYASTPWLVANGVGSGWLAGHGVTVAPMGEREASQ